MPIILNQRYRNLLTGRIVTLLDIRDDTGLLHDGRRITTVDLWNFRTFFDLAKEMK